MNRETLYASLAGCASFVLIAYGSYWYFSPAKPAGDPATEKGSSPAKSVAAIPAEPMVPPPIVVRQAAPDNVSPLPAVPSQSAPPTPTAYGSAIGAGAQKASSTVQDDEEGERTLRTRRRPVRTMQEDRKVTYAERRRMRSHPDEDE